MADEMMMGLTFFQAKSLWMSSVATRQNLITQSVQFRRKRLTLVLAEHVLDDYIAVHFQVVALGWRQGWPGPVEFWSIIHYSIESICVYQLTSMLIRHVYAAMALRSLISPVASFKTATVVQRLPDPSGRGQSLR